MHPPSVQCPVHLNSLSFPERVAIKAEGVSISYGDLEKRVCQLAAGLRSRGVIEGTRVGVFSRNSVEYAVLVFALYRVGATIVPISVRLGRDDFSAIVRTTGCGLILIDGELSGSADAVECDCLVLEDSGSERGDGSGTSSDTAVSHEIRLESEASIVFTSGSGGMPRGVTLTVGNHYYNARASNQNIRLTGGDCWLAVLPFYHVGGLAILFRCALAGCTSYVMRRFNVDSVNQLIDEELVTHVSLVPSMLTPLLEARRMREFPATLKVVLLGGEPVPHHLVESIRALSLPVLTTYGMTEAASQVCTMALGDPPEKLLSSGRPLMYSEVRIVDSEGKAVEEGGDGEIAIRGRILFKGYLGELEGGSVDCDGWFRTGDMGRFDSDGLLYVMGRKDEMFVSGGENMYPSEIEKAAGQFPSVAECAAIAVESSTWGKRPVLFVRSINESGIDMAELKRHLRGILRRIAVPEKIIEMAEFPRRASGKIDKRRLRQLYSEENRR